MNDADQNHTINEWTKKSIELAKDKDYLDKLLEIYPIKVSEQKRTQLSDEAWEKIEKAFDNNNENDLINELLNLERFPIDNSYVGYLRKDENALSKNPVVVKKINDIIHQMGKNRLKRKCKEPKSASRQLGQSFKNYLDKADLGIKKFYSELEFESSEEDGILNLSDAQLKKFAQTKLEYTRKKGLDFLARVNGKYIIGEAKFITDFGGSQNNQFNDACETADLSKDKVKSIAILDGVLYIDRPTLKSYKEKFNKKPDRIIISALLLKDFIESLRK